MLSCLSAACVRQTYVCELLANVELALEELERLGVVAEAVLDDLLHVRKCDRRMPIRMTHFDSSQVTGLDVNRLPHLCKGSFSKPNVSLYRMS